MIKKIFAAVLSLSIMTTAFAGAASAQTTRSATDEKANEAAAAAALRRKIFTSPDGKSDVASQKSTMADYDRMKKQGKGLSTPAKVLIIGGIAAAVIAIIVVAGKNDLENNILR